MLFEFKSLFKFFPVFFGESVDGQMVSVKLSDFIYIYYDFDLAFILPLFFLLVLINQSVVIYKMMALVCLLFLVLISSLFFLTWLFILDSNFLELTDFYYKGH